MPRGKHKNHKSGSDHPRWGNGRQVHTNGYARLRVGAAHPLSDRNGWAYEHLLVWCAAGNAKPSSSDVLHHRNGDKLDNRIENLHVMSRSDHNSHHLADRPRDSAGRLLDGVEHNGMPEAGR